MPAIARRPSRAASASLPPGATRTITATFDVPLTYPGLGPIVNVASVSATTPDAAAANNTATVETTLNRHADVAISKSVAPASVLVGQPTTFTVVVTNHGPARVTALVVQDLLPAGLSFVSASAFAGELHRGHGDVDDRDAADHRSRRR